MSYATFEDEEAQLPPPTKPTCSIRRVFSVALVVTVGLVYAAASGARHATPLEHFIGEETYVCYYQDRCYALYKIPALCQAAAGHWTSLKSICNQANVDGICYNSGSAKLVCQCDLC